MYNRMIYCLFFYDLDEVVIFIMKTAVFQQGVHMQTGRFSLFLLLLTLLFFTLFGMEVARITNAPELNAATQLIEQ